MSEWKECKLGDMAHLVKDTYKPKIGDHLPYIGLEHVQEQGLRLLNIGDSDSVTSQKFHFKPNDVLFGKLRPYFRKVVKPRFAGICSTDIWVVRALEGNDQNFIFYFFANQEFVDTANSGDSGTRMPRADWHFVKDTIWPFPPLPEQRAIAGVLGSLDDKIDLLHRQNKTLEGMAEALWRKMFVPACAGEPHADREEADAGWKKGKLGDYLKIQGGYAFKSIDFKDIGEIGIIKITNISGGLVDIINTQFVNKNIVDTLDRKFKILTGSILIAMTGAEIGKIGIVEKTEKEMWLNQRVGIFKETREFGNQVGFFALNSEEGQEHILSSATGSAQPNISSTGIEDFEIPIVTDSVLNGFGIAVKPFFDKICFNLGQIRTLSRLRDTLLPKLISGEMRVKVSNKMAEVSE